MKKLFTTGLLATTLLLPFKKANAQTAPADSINPFIQPKATTIYYGSGDVNNDGKIDYQDLQTMQTISNDQSDIDGDGISSTQNDRQIFQNYLDKKIKYLPGHWNDLETREERKDWVMKMFKIDKTDTLDVSVPLPNWDCNEYSIQTGLNFHGIEDTTNIPSKFDKTNLRRFNLPVYYVYVDRPASYGDNHAVNAILIGDSALDFNDLLSIEPQTDKEVKLGDWNMPKDSKITIKSIEGFNDNGNPTGAVLVKYQLNGYTPELLRYNDKLITTKPSTGINDGIKEPVIQPTNYELGQNYPNPFNSETTIRYKLQKQTHVTLKIYSVLGQAVKTLVNDYQIKGTYSVKWDGRNDLGHIVSSGVYLYRMQTGDYAKIKKMIFLR